MKEIRLYYDKISEDIIWNGSPEEINLIPNCTPNDKGFTFSHYGFLITKAVGEQNYKNYQNDFKIVLTNNRSKKYVYVVEPQGVHTQLFKSLPKLIDKDVFKDIQNGNAILCISYIHEGDNHKDFYKDVNKFCNDNSISLDNFMFLTNNPNIKKTNNVFNIDYYYSHVSTVYQNDYKYADDECRINKLENLDYNKIRDNYFICYNRSPKLHRTILISFLLKENLLDKGLASLGPMDRIDTEERDNWIESSRNWRTPIYSELKKEIMPHWEKVKEMSPMTIDIPSDIMVDGYMSSWKGIYPKTYNDTYFSLVTSTSFDTPWTHPDEKFWKPLGQFHPFIWIGPVNSLDNLRKLGFQSFSPWIDESYDKEEDCEKRMLMIVNEIKRLCNMSKREIHEWYYSMDEVLLHNWRRILEYNPNPFTDLYNKLYFLTKE